ncbi:MAG: response regulator transcription factor [Rhodobacteraceae bacterium]|nr:response regulator transcription factor [Paracoccaceae bacterium]
MRVLIVDDQRMKIEQATRVLKNIFPNAEYRSSKNFHRAISMLEGFQWDLVILDMSFSINDNPSDYAGFEGLAGVQVLQYLFRSDIKTKVIIFTAHTQFEDPYLSVGTLEDLERLILEYFEDICLGCVFSKLPDSELENVFKELTAGIEDINEK